MRAYNPVFLGDVYREQFKLTRHFFESIDHWKEIKLNYLVCYVLRFGNIFAVRVHFVANFTEQNSGFGERAPYNFQIVKSRVKSKTPPHNNQLSVSFGKVVVGDSVSIVAFKYRYRFSLKFLILTVGNFFLVN